MGGQPGICPYLSISHVFITFHVTPVEATGGKGGWHLLVAKGPRGPSLRASTSRATSWVMWSHPAALSLRCPDRHLSTRPIHGPPNLPPPGLCPQGCHEMEAALHRASTLAHALSNNNVLAVVALGGPEPGAGASVPATVLATPRGRTPAREQTGLRWVTGAGPGSRSGVRRGRARRAMGSGEIAPGSQGREACVGPWWAPSEIY